MRKLVLVTGMPRSGTTVIGERLVGSQVRELYEPMSVSVGDIQIRRQFELVGSAGFSDKQANRFVSRVRQGALFGHWPPRDVPRHPLFNRTRRTMAFVLLDRLLKGVVWKDPFAIFWSTFVASKEIPVIVTLRDPLATAASFTRMGWSFDTPELSNRLNKNGFACQVPTRDEEEDIRQSVRDAAALWYLTQSFVLAQLEAGIPLVPIWIEENISDPDRVGALLALATGMQVRQEEALTAEDTENTRMDELPAKAHIRDRSASSITDYWKKTLTEAEVAHCRFVTEELEARLRPVVETVQSRLLEKST